MEDRYLLGNGSFGMSMDGGVPTEEIILNQRMQLAKQDALLAQSKKQHEEQMKAISNLEENQQMQNDYLAMTEANTRITSYFVTADYINKYI